MEYEYVVTDSPKSLRETLCIAQNAVNHSIHNRSRQKMDLDTLQRLIDAIYVMRPIGPDGKHGNRHTKNCGCEDV